jgi:hypothetical protein
MAYDQPGPYGGEPAGNEDYFADAPASQKKQGTKPPGEGDEESKEEGEYGETAVIPKALLGGKEFKPGDEMVVQIVAVHGDRVEIKYAPEGGKGEEGEGEGEAQAEVPPGAQQGPPPGGGDKEMAAMMQ